MSRSEGGNFFYNHMCMMAQVRHENGGWIEREETRSKT